MCQYSDPVKIFRILFCLVALAMVSCQSDSPSTGQVNSEPRSGEQWSHTIDPGTEYYKGGPQQGSPPDGQIPGGTRVKLLENAGSYSLVEAESGENGYVSTFSLKVIEN